MDRRYGRPVWWVLCALWLAVIIGHSLMPAQISQAESRGLLARLASGLPFLTDHLLRKAAHFSEFGLLGLLLAQCLRAGFAQPALAALLCALADETVQLYVPGRSGQVRDILIDWAEGPPGPARAGAADCEGGAAVISAAASAARETGIAFFQSTRKRLSFGGTLPLLPRGS